MRNKPIIWITLSIITVIVYAVLTNWSIKDELLYSIGILFVPFFVTLILPVTTSLLIAGGYTLITKKKDFDKLFSQVMWTTQIIAILIVLFSIIGNSMLNNDENVNNTQANMIDVSMLTINKKKVSNELIEFEVPQDWECKFLEKQEDQIYNIICYFSQGTLRVSAISEHTGLTPKRYYVTLKDVLFSDIRNNMQDFIIIDESDIRFLDEQAFRILYQAKYKGISLFGENIIVSKNNQMVLIGSMTKDQFYPDILSEVLKSIMIKHQ